MSSEVLLDVAVFALLVSSWALGNRWYRLIWGYPLRLWAWPFVLGALLLDRRLLGWEKRTQARCSKCKVVHRWDWCCDPTCACRVLP